MNSIGVGKEKPQLAFSILSCNFIQLGEQLAEAENSGKDCCFHLDIMDGVFVPNISFGHGIVKQVKEFTNKFLDVHLMIIDPDRYITTFVEAGSNLISIHAEASNHLHRTIETIKSLGCKAGVAINPATPLSSIEEVLSIVDQVILMSVNPGFGGQQFIDNIRLKLTKLVEMCKLQRVKPVIEIDGGVNINNVAELVDLGATRLVLGSAIFNAHSSITDNLNNIYKALD